MIVFTLRKIRDNNHSHDSQIYSFYGRIANCQNNDDDNNGYVDDYRGYDMNGHSNYVDDYNGHGTHCAGIAAAVLVWLMMVMCFAVAISTDTK